MANIDKKPVRSEVDKVKVEFQSLCDAGKVSSEITVLMSSMLMIMELILSIIPRYDGVIIHDCWASYLSYKHCAHGLCGSHLLRELTFIVESNVYPWARNLKRLL